MSESHWHRDVMNCSDLDVDFLGQLSDCSIDNG